MFHLKGSLRPIIEIYHDRIGFMTSISPTDRLLLFNLDCGDLNGEKFDIIIGSCVRVYGFELVVTDVAISVLREDQVIVSQQSFEHNLVLRIQVKDKSAIEAS